ASRAADLFPPMDHPELGVTAPAAAASASESDQADGGDLDRADGMMAPGGDRDSLRLSERDEELIAAAAASNPSTVVSVQCGSAVMMPWIDSVPTVLVSWYCGVEGGHALADLLVGDAEPGGRLPFVIPADAADLVHFDKDATEETYGLLHGQWHLDATERPAAHPFGAGLGFTDWQIGGALAVDDDTVRVRVENTGSRPGSTVVFVHAAVPDSSVERPARRLVGFARAAAEAGDSAEIDVAVDWRQLDVRRDGSWWREPGRCELHVGFDATHRAHVVEVDRR
ncbi:MAG: glycoside hydrolase family 3 C-terminal domain-containing protein, partial [Ilumatobacter sp.]